MMKKIFVLGVTVLTAFSLAACGTKAMDVSGKTAAGYGYDLTIKSESEHVYWKAPGQTIQRATKTPNKKGEYYVSLSKHVSPYKVTVADNQEFKRSSTITVPKTSPIESTDEFLEPYTEYPSTYTLDGSYIHLPDTLKNGKSTFRSNGVELTLSVNDDQIVGVSVSNFQPDKESTSVFRNTVSNLGVAFDAKPYEINRVIHTLSKDGSKFKKKIAGVTYYGADEKNVGLVLNIYK